MACDYCDRQRHVTQFYSSRVKVAEIEYHRVCHENNKLRKENEKLRANQMKHLILMSEVKNE